MRVLALSNTATDLAAQNAPFLPNYTMVFANPTAGELIVQESDDGSTGWTTVATVPADGFIEGTPVKQYVRVSTAAIVYALGN
jgi:hypothetical protein